MCQSNQTDLVSEIKKFIVRRVKHLLEVSAGKQVVLTNQHLQHTIKKTSLRQNLAETMLNNVTVNFLKYLLTRLFDLHQNGDNQEQQHHPRGHADYCPVSLCDVMENTFVLFLWRVEVKMKELQYERLSEMLRAHQSFTHSLPCRDSLYLWMPGTIRNLYSKLKHRQTLEMLKFHL